MPDFNGLDFIKTIKKPIKIILTTSDPKFAIEAFEYDFIVDYLLKPIELPRFQKAIKRLRQLSQKYIKKDSLSSSSMYN